MTLDDAVSSPRIHYEADVLNVEGSFDMDELKSLLPNYLKHKAWEERNLFFGGVHSVCAGTSGFSGVGDPRRGGFAIEVFA